MIKPTYDRIDSAPRFRSRTKADAVTLIDRNGIILSVNESAVERFARPVEELIGAYVCEFYLPTSRNQHKILLKQVVRSGRSITLITRHKDFSTRTLIYPVHGETDQIEKVALCTWDITSLVEAQERYKRLALELFTVQDEERYRISRDLHDDIGKRMTALTLDFRSIESALENGQNIAVDKVRSAIRDLEVIIKQTRQILYQLHPPSLDTMALPKVLAAFCASFEVSTGMDIDFSCQADMPELSDLQTTIIYRFVQEGLANTAKHAMATQAWINLDYTDGHLNISLEDDGKGFEPMNIPEGMGLHGIRE